jgi:hypothetical protein
VRRLALLVIVAVACLFCVYPTTGGVVYFNWSRFRIRLFTKTHPQDRHVFKTRNNVSPKNERHCATSRKAVGSILDKVFKIFHWLHPSGRTMALVSTQRVTEMSTRHLPRGGGGGKSGRVLGLTLPPSSADCLKIVETSTSRSPRGLSRPVQGELFLT